MRGHSRCEPALRRAGRGAASVLTRALGPLGAPGAVAALPAAACFDAQAGLPAAKLTKQLRLFREARGLPFEHQAAAGSRRVRENDGEAAADELERVMEALEQAYGQCDEPRGD